MKYLIIVSMQMVCALATHALEIEIFTASAIPLRMLSGHQVRYYALDEPDRLAAQLPDLRTRDPNQATIQAKAWIRAYGDRYAQALRRASQGWMKVMEYRIDRVPAITFENGRYVVYGTTDITRALQQYSACVADMRRTPC